MKLANVIEGGLAGATTLSLIQEALHKVDSKAPRPFLHKSDAIKKFRNGSDKKGDKSKLYIQIAGELLASTAYFGLSGLGKKKNAVLRGGLLGAAAGLASAFLDDQEKHKEDHLTGMNGSAIEHRNDVKDKVLTVSLYTAGGLLAGAAIKKINKKTIKKMKKGFKKKS